jgi:DNA-binding MarR family transcriptional regulator
LTGATRTPRECGQLLLETVPNLMRHVREAVRHQPCGDDEPLSMSQYLVLEMLSHHVFSLKDLAAVHHVTPSTMSRSVDLLVRRGWIERTSDQHDRRQVTLNLTELGRDTRRQMMGHVQDTVTDLMAQLNDDERRRVYDGLSVLCALVARVAGAEHDSRPFPGFRRGPIGESGATNEG